MQKIELSTLHFHQDSRNECCNIKALLGVERCARIGSIYFFLMGRRMEGEGRVWEKESINRLPERVDSRT